MSKDQHNQSKKGDENNRLSGSIGNASNPLPEQDTAQASGSNQLIDEKGEKYLREIASIEDLPDAQDQQDIDQAINENKDA